MNAKEALTSFSYSERLKSGLILAFKLIEQVREMSKEERGGANRLLRTFISFLLNEANLALHVSKDESFKDVILNLEESVRNIDFEDYPEAMRNLSKAISSTTTVGQGAVVALKEAELL